jgi:Zn-dependent protease with chaperone function
LIVDGQRVRWHPQTRVKAKGITSMDAIPLGYEVSIRGTRLTDGSILANELEAKPNGLASFENEVRQAGTQVEQEWVREGMLFQFYNGVRRNVGRVTDTGSDAERARGILRRLVPPYLQSTEFRVRVVDTGEWNAAALPNGAIWVHKGLIDSASDDELAVVLGHELAHYSHEHTRRMTRNLVWVQIADAAARVAISHIDNAAGAASAEAGRLLSLAAWQNGYSRELEDQADRVGLRYAYEAGFDVSSAIGFWERVRQKNGQADRVTNFFVGSHSRPSDRIQNIRRELAANFPSRVR